MQSALACSDFRIFRLLNSRWVQICIRCGCLFKPCGQGHCSAIILQNSPLFALCYAAAPCLNTLLGDSCFHFLCCTTQTRWRLCALCGRGVILYLCLLSQRTGAETTAFGQRMVYHEVTVPPNASLHISVFRWVNTTTNSTDSKQNISDCLATATPAQFKMTCFETCTMLTEPRQPTTV